MQTIKEFQALSPLEQENFIAHAAANLTQAMYYGHDQKGLEVLIKNMETIAEQARNCLDCLVILHQKGDVFAKIYLLLEYMSKDGVTQDFVDGLEELTERAQECVQVQDAGGVTTDDERKVLENLRKVIDKHSDDEENN